MSKEIQIHSEKCKKVTNKSAAEEIQKRLKCGNKNFMKGKLTNEQEINEQRIRWENTQKPFAIVLSCADSRVIPELIFDTELGELFVVRVAGNIANISSIASIEYAVAVLKCKYILVLGHEECGAVEEAKKVAVTGKPAPSDNLNQLVGHILPAVNTCKCTSSKRKEPSLKNIIIENTYHSASELVRCSKILQKAVRKSGVEIHTGYYHLASGKVEFDKKSKC
ncbi:carbonic anhydrase [Kordia sp.]|uniref:carbonic anhydrase n=1 Tax=Kordia sp. TaxID=1965332 RepID=UPI003B5B939A